MNWVFDDKRPVYIQIAETIKHMVLKGEYKAGDKLPSVRDLSVEAAVNPNTMQRALAELERQGFLRTERTNGKYITEDSEFIMNERNTLAENIVKDILLKLIEMGFTKEEIISFVEKCYEGGLENGSTAV